MLTSPVFVAQIWEPPQVPQPDQGSCHGQQELHFVRPLAAVQQLILLHQRVVWTGHLEAVSFEKVPGHIQVERQIDEEKTNDGS